MPAIVVIVIIALLIAAIVYYTRRWRDRKILEVEPLALQAKGLNRDVLMALARQKKENAQLLQTLGNIAGLLEQALSDNIITVWGPATKQTIERAQAAARKTIRELEK